MARRVSAKAKARIEAIHKGAAEGMAYGDLAEQLDMSITALDNFRKYHGVKVTFVRRDPRTIRPEVRESYIDAIRKGRAEGVSRATLAKQLGVALFVIKNLIAENEIPKTLTKPKTEPKPRAAPKVKTEPKPRAKRGRKSWLDTFEALAPEERDSILETIRKGKAQGLSSAQIAEQLDKSLRYVTGLCSMYSIYATRSNGVDWEARIATIRQGREQGLTHSALAQRMGLSAGTVKLICAQHKIYGPPTVYKWKPKPGTFDALPAEARAVVAEVVRKGIAEGATQKALAKQLGYGLGTIRKLSALNPYSRTAYTNKEFRGLAPKYFKYDESEHSALVICRECGWRYISLTLDESLIAARPHWETHTPTKRPQSLPKELK